MTNKADYKKWANEFFKAWASLKPTKILALLNRNVEYHETPFSGPCKSWSKVEKLWRVIPHNQKSLQYKYEVIMTDKDKALIYSNVRRIKLPENKPQEIDGVSLVKLNSKGLCTFFKQWRVVKE